MAWFPIRDAKGFLTKGGWQFIIWPSTIFTFFWIGNGLLSPFAYEIEWLPSWMLWAFALLNFIAFSGMVIIIVDSVVALFRTLSLMKEIGIVGTQQRDVVKKLEQLLFAVVLSYPICVSTFASMAERFYFLDPKSFTGTPVSNRFDFFYHALLVMTTIDVPQQQ